MHFHSIICESNGEKYHQLLN